MLHVKIAGLGHYLPERIVTSAELEADYGLEAGWIERVTGIKERRRATHETTVRMGAIAGQRALAAAGLAIDDVDLIVAAASGRQQAIPCTAAYLQRELGAPDGGSTCFDIDATCLSFLVALQSVAHLVAAGSYRTALIISSERAGYALNPNQPESAVLFGDAAAAAVLVRAPANEASAVVWEQFATYSSGADLTAILGGGTLHHPNDPTTTPEMNTFAMNGSAIYKKAARLFEPFFDSFCVRTGWAREEIDAVVPHQASGHALEILARRYGFRREQLIINLPSRGNCIAASIPLALAEAVADGRIVRGKRVVLLGTGAGLTLGAIGVIF
ncbi:beta-ketoacyl-ACP synthase 3 [Candidatus Chloroploca sp. M-50]|uniref:Beta-ketoacyl-ACP synthase 3 n=1 Tax=Candidatus Chloroploca mongolica TaxID=2528176 RepID=A0ABS4D4G8_9CHLR|nr:beta-ketoacyl-ACP synthase 3 [Candidatus Chloroploca mongolica]MBP1464334.1 beta-ketoacyl-ACP synthase 3 [Candidatus Chloroploca mongolica]